MLAGRKTMDGIMPLFETVAARARTFVAIIWPTMDLKPGFDYARRLCWRSPE